MKCKKWCSQAKTTQNRNCSLDFLYRRKYQQKLAKMMNQNYKSLKEPFTSQFSYPRTPQRFFWDICDIWQVFTITMWINHKTYVVHNEEFAMTFVFLAKISLWHTLLKRSWKKSTLKTTENMLFIKISYIYIPIHKIITYASPHFFKILMDEHSWLFSMCGHCHPILKLFVCIIA